MNRSFLVWMGVLGCVAFPLFYLLRFTGKLPPRYDDLALRTIATLLCLVLALRPWWPAKVRPFYLAYSYATAWYCLAFLLTFTTLKNQGDPFSFVNMLIGAMCIILVADWRNATVMLLSGYALGAIVFWASRPGIAFPPELWIWMPAPALLFVAGALSHFERRQAERARHRLYMSFAGSIAHEMRGPMQKIHSVFDAVERDFLRMGPSQSSVSLTREQVMAMMRVLNEGRNAIKLGLQSITVTLQQLKTKAFDTTGFTFLSAAACTERAVSDFGYESEAQRERVRLVEVVDFAFKGEENLLTLILFNLIKNALYYLPARPNATVTVTVDARRITVRDTGPGIAPEKMEHLFEDFQTSGKVDGTGLGLPFCRRAMRALGGDIRCASKLGDFTEFTLMFPAMPPTEASAHDEESMRHAARLLRGARVLLVNDDPVRRRATLAKLLALVGSSSIDEAGDGAQALDLMRWAIDVPYDLVVMDLDMPVLDGFETVRQIRLGATPGHEQVPVLAHCGQPVVGARAKSREAGMDGFLRSPCTLPELASAVVGLLKDQPMRNSTRDSAPFTGHTVLLAEDNAVSRAIVKSYLKDMGLQVVEAQQGLEVLQYMRAGVRPDMILMDVDMPVLDGMEATRQLRAMTDGVRNIPVVALTGHSSQEDRQAARDAGMDGFLSKPVNVVALRGELARLIGQRPVGEARATSASPSPARSAGATIDGPLLDVERVEQLKSMNIMVNLLPDGLAQARRHIANLEDAVRRNDLRSARQALHSLAGLSGEMGAHAMFVTAKQHSLVVESDVWPFEPNWLERLGTLFLESEQALLTSFALRNTSP